MFVGLGEASYASVCPSLISDSFEGRKRNLALSIFYVGLPLGAALGYIISGQLHEADRVARGIPVGRARESDADLCTAAI